MRFPGKIVTALPHVAAFPVGDEVTSLQLVPLIPCPSPVPAICNRRPDATVSPSRCLVFRTARRRLQTAGTRIHPAASVSAHRTNTARPVSQVSVFRNDPVRLNASVSARRKGAVLTENAFLTRWMATFRPESAFLKPGTLLFDRTPPIRHAQTRLPAPPTPILPDKTTPSDQFCPTFPAQPTQTQPFSHKAAKEAQKLD